MTSLVAVEFRHKQAGTDRSRVRCTQLLMKALRVETGNSEFDPIRR